MFVIILQKISDEILRYTKSTPISKILGDVIKFKIAFIIAIVWSFPNETISKVYSILSYSNFFAPKFAFGLFIGYIVLPYLLKRYKRQNNVELIEGIPIDELVTHIIETESFKREDMEMKFAMPRSKHKTIADLLDDSIFTRGENNKRCLREGVTREDIVTTLRSSLSTSLPCLGFTRKKLNFSFTDAGEEVAND